MGLPKRRYSERVSSANWKHNTPSVLFPQSHFAPGVSFGSSSQFNCKHHQASWPLAKWQGAHRGTPNIKRQCSHRQSSNSTAAISNRVPAYRAGLIHNACNTFKALPVLALGGKKKKSPNCTRSLSMFLAAPSFQDLRQPQRACPPSAPGVTCLTADCRALLSSATLTSASWGFPWLLFTSFGFRPFKNVSEHHLHSGGSVFLRSYYFSLEESNG